MSALIWVDFATSHLQSFRFWLTQLGMHFLLQLQFWIQFSVVSFSIVNIISDILFVYEIAWKK